LLSPKGLFLAQNVSKIVCRPGSARIAGGAYSAPPDTLAGFKGPTSKEGEGKGREEKGRGGKGREGEGKEGKGGHSGLPPYT